MEQMLKNNEIPLFFLFHFVFHFFLKMEQWNKNGTETEQKAYYTLQFIEIAI